ncbi:MAG: hypothetical protein ACR2O7_15530, partial [Parasphingorhabdus sp.]
SCPARTTITGLRIFMQHNRLHRPKTAATGPGEAGWAARATRKARIKRSGAPEGMKQRGIPGPERPGCA